MDMQAQAQKLEQTIREAMAAKPLQFEKKIAGYIVKSQCTKGTASVIRAGLPPSRDSTMIARETDLTFFMETYKLRMKRA